MNWWIAKGFLLGLWLSSFGTIAYLYLAIYRRLPGPVAVGTTVFTAYTVQNPLWWAGLVACFVIGFAIAKSWPGKPIFWVALAVTELIPVGLVVMFVMLVARMRDATQQLGQ
jgi:hypothetical protein